MSARRMSRPARFLTRLRALWSRTPTVAVALAVITLCGWTLHEVVPRYGVERHRHEGPGRLDHPTFLIGDCAYYRATLVSLLEDGDLDVQNNLGTQRYPLASNVSRGRHGEFYPKHPILLAVVALPFYVVAGDIGLLAFNLAQLCALVLVMWVGARRYASDLVAFALMVWFAFGTLLRPAAYNFAPDVLSSLLVVGAIVALLYGRCVVAGLLLVCATALALNVRRGRHGEAEEGEDVDLTAPTEWRVVLPLVGAFLANVLLIDLLGWAISGALLFWGSSWALGSRHPVRDAVISLALSLATFYGFYLGLGIQLPAGLLEGVL